MKTNGFSMHALSLRESITHGTRASIEKANEHLGSEDKIIDLSIGTLDTPTDVRIDQGVCDFIRQKADIIHAFGPVKGLRFLRESIAAKTFRMHGINFDPGSEIIVTPGGIKGTLSLLFHTLLDYGDEVIVPVPNWPHYADMLRLHGAIPKAVMPRFSINHGLKPLDLQNAINKKTKLIILGDCINPTGKIYSSQELYGLAQVIANHNLERIAQDENPILVIFDCPYEAHILKQRAKTFAAIEIKQPDETYYSMRQHTITVSGPGKSYGMHGDRIGYACAPKDIIDMAERVQVNLNSFASNYGQVATYIATQDYMDEVAVSRAQMARKSLNHMFEKLSKIPLLNIDYPEGGYFLFVDFSECEKFYQDWGYDSADDFLLNEARVATIAGNHFVDGAEDIQRFRHFVRINCGRSLDLLNQSCERIEKALSKVSHEKMLSAGSVTPPAMIFV
jgi:aspartate/methionine/tyrosine aminotransferase